jgi:rubrerythrin
MAAADLVELILESTFACLSVPAPQNPLFSQLFPDMDSLADTMATASLSFCPGLMDAAQSASPPALSWYKQLPSDHRGKWGVYVLVFEKEDQVPLLYCGSASDTRYGVASRWWTYDRHSIQLQENKEGLPTRVLRAFEAGYKITHKGLLVTCPVPSAANVPSTRLLVYALEAMFSYCMWMMESFDNVHFHSCAWWSLEHFTYLGLCSHSALNDVVTGRFDLSPEELMRLADITNERRRLYVNLKVSQRAKRLKETDPETWSASERERSARFRASNPDSVRTSREKFHATHPEKQREYANRHREKVKLSGKFRCVLCGVGFANIAESRRHDISKRHLKRVEKAKKGVVMKWKCEPCGYATETKGDLATHQRSKTHLKNVQRAEA